MRGDHSGVGDNHDVAPQGVAIFLQKFPKILTADLLFAFDNKIDVYRQIAALLDRFLNTKNVGENLAFVIRRAARKNISVFQNRLERRRIPKLKRIGRLHVVVPVNQNRRTPLSMLVARPNDRVARGCNQLRLQADTGQLFNQPVRAFAYSFRIIVVRGNAWKPQKRIEILEMTGAHGCTLAEKTFPRREFLGQESAPKKMSILQMTNVECRSTKE